MYVLDYINYVKTTGKYKMKDKNDKMVNFRCNADLWEQFSNFAKSHNSTASALLKELMINAMGGNRDIEISITDIDNSIKEGAIGAAIDKHYQQAIAYITDIDSRLRVVEKMVHTDDVPTDVKTDDVPTDVKTDDVPTDVKTDDVPTDVKTDVKTDDDTLFKLGLADIAAGALYNADFLADSGIFAEIDKNKELVESMGIAYRKEEIAVVNAVLVHYGYTPRRTTRKKIKYYFVG